MFSDQNKIQNSTEEDMSCASVLRDEDQLGLCFAIQMLPCSCLAALLLVGGRQHQRRWSATIVCSKAMNLASLNSFCVWVSILWEPLNCVSLRVMSGTCFQALFCMRKKPSVCESHIIIRPHKLVA